MRTRRLWLCAACLSLLAAGISCTKEVPGSAGGEENTGLCTVRFNLCVGAHNKTKAYSIGQLDEDAIHRIDVFEYNGDDWDKRPTHYALTGEEISSGVFHAQQPYGKQCAYLFYVNLSEEIVDKITSSRGLDLYQTRFRAVDLYTDTSGIPMASSAWVTFTADQTLEVALERFLYRVDVGEIKVDFDDASWMNKDVFVKRIALINLPSFKALTADYVSYIGSYNIATVIFGSQYTSISSKPYFGNLESVNHGDNVMHNSSYSCYLPSTGGTVSMDPVMNKNTRSNAGVMNIDATGWWLDQTVQSYNTGLGEGRVCSSTNPGQNHTLTVNKSLYALVGCFNSGEYGILQTVSQQNTYPKLVVELSVDGVTHFYPIQMYYPQHNTAYKIDRITIKSAGSNYANFFEKMFSANVSMSLSDWDDIPFSNVNVGYANPVGTEVYE